MRTHGRCTTMLLLSLLTTLSLNAAIEKIALRQRHFESGTVRIQKPGYYLIEEDILFAPNPDTEAVREKRGVILPGTLNELRADKPMNGWFAAISVEADDVTIDLGGHAIRQKEGSSAMDIKAYSHIELANSPFPSPAPPFFAFAFRDTIHNEEILRGINRGQLWGSKKGFTSAHAVTIKNGNLGFSSHMAIHGNNNSDIHVSDVLIHDWEVAGVALNAVKNSSMKRVRISGIQHKIPANSMFFLLRDLQRMLSELVLHEGTRIRGADGYQPFSSAEKAAATYYLEAISKIFDPIRTRVITNARDLNETFANNLINNDISFGKISFTGQQAFDHDKNSKAHLQLQTFNTSGLPDGNLWAILFNNKFSVATFTDKTDPGINDNNILEDICVSNIRAEVPEFVCLHINTANAKRVPPPGVLLDGQAYVLLWNHAIYSDETHKDAVFRPTIVQTAQIFAMSVYLKRNVPGVPDLFSSAVMQNGGAKNWSQFASLYLNLTTYLPLDAQAKTVTESITAYAESQETWLKSVQPSFDLDNRNHTGKGIVGIRIDGGRGTQIKNCSIVSMENSGPQSMTTENSSLENQQIGFAPRYLWLNLKRAHKNDVRGISLAACRGCVVKNNLITDLKSKNGDSLGIDIFNNATHNVVEECVITSCQGFQDDGATSLFSSQAIVNTPSKAIGVHVGAKSHFNTFKQVESSGHYAPRNACGFLVEESNFTQFIGCIANDIQALSQKNNMSLDHPKNAVGFGVQGAESTIIKYCLCYGANADGGSGSGEDGSCQAAGFFLGKATKDSVIQKCEVRRTSAGDGIAAGILIESSNHDTIEDNVVSSNTNPEGSVGKSYGIRDKAENSSAIIIKNVAYHNGTNYRVSYTDTKGFLPIVSTTQANIDTIFNMNPWCNISIN